MPLQRRCFAPAVFDTASAKQLGWVFPRKTQKAKPLASVPLLPTDFVTQGEEWDCIPPEACAVEGMSERRAPYHNTLESWPAARLRCN